MRYLVDGHNLIPKIHDLSLRDLEDEEKLISLLNRFSTKARVQVEVYFDRAPMDSARTVKIGAVKVHFIRKDSTADAAIIERVRKIGTSNKGIAIVSSDHAIQNEAKRMKIPFISSEEFSTLMEEKMVHMEEIKGKEPTLNEEEVSEWLNLFNKEP